MKATLLLVATLAGFALAAKARVDERECEGAPRSAHAPQTRSARAAAESLLWLAASPPSAPARRSLQGGHRRDR
jgi:hypothetical protein